MGIIIDANASHEFINQTEDGAPVFNRVMTGKLKIVAGHQLKEELLKTAFRRLYKQLVLAGRLIEADNDEVDKEYKKNLLDCCVSNDRHVIALARVSGARLLFSADEPLHADFKNKTIIDNPRGKIYSSAKHEKILDGRV